jgi:hypothetical protein
MFSFLLVLNYISGHKFDSILNTVIHYKVKRENEADRYLFQHSYDVTINGIAANRQNIIPGKRSEPNERKVADNFYIYNSTGFCTVPSKN